VDLSSSSGDDDSDEDLDEIIGAASATIPLTRLESNVTSEAGGSLARRDSIDTLNDSDLDFGSDLPEYTGEEFQSGDFGTSDVTGGRCSQSVVSVLCITRVRNEQTVFFTHQTVNPWSQRR
jgi:hypothetical protein